jgi:hypothetical protein
MRVHRGSIGAGVHQQSGGEKNERLAVSISRANKKKKKKKKCRVLHFPEEKKKA